jgi:hypothetical protein
LPKRLEALQLRLLSDASQLHGLPSVRYYSMRLLSDNWNTHQYQVKISTNDGHQCVCTILSILLAEFRLMNLDRSQHVESDPFQQVGLWLSGKIITHNSMTHLTYHPGFEPVKNPRVFFRPGKVFLALWAEAARNHRNTIRCRLAVQLALHMRTYRCIS